MKKLYIIVLILLLPFQIIFSQKEKMQQDLTQFVNPFIGTGGHGHTYPGAVVPFGMVQLSPDTRLEGWDGCSGYHYSDSIIYGFSHMHLSGTGVPDYCDILIMPTVGDVKFENYDYKSSFTHSKEFASPGYYSVYLEKYNVKAELTATTRAGFHKYTFPKSDKAGFIIDLKHREEVIESSIEIVGNNEIRGMHRTHGWAKNKYVYFDMKFSKPFKKVLIAQNDTEVSEIKSAEGKNIKAWVIFDTKENEQVFVKCGISAVDFEGTVKNLDKEIPGWDFDGVKNQAKNLWNQELNKIVVDDPRNELKMIFYSALYHCMLAPNVFEDVDGSYRGTDIMVHRPSIIGDKVADGKPEPAIYTVFSLWDTYRAEHPLLTIIDTKRTRDFISTFLTEAEYGGMLPVWELWGNETFCMIGYHSIPVIVDAYVKGIHGFNEELAFYYMEREAERDRFGLESYKKFGCVQQDMEHESVSKTLEYAYDDWCIAQMAKSLGKTEDYVRYIQRAQYYKNVFDPSTGFMRAKINGGWYSPFDPFEINSNYTEANAWQYSFYAPQDMSGLIKLYGESGLKLSSPSLDRQDMHGIFTNQLYFCQKLDNLFSADSKISGNDLEDVSGMIGQYAHGNEPSHHMAYLYDYANQPWKTQELVHKIMNEFYKNDTAGLIGNEDCGQMSAWYVLSALGFYQVCPGQLQYAIGTPLFKKVTINLENGKKFVIRAENFSNNNYYIQSAELNGKQYSKCYISHPDIMQGGELVFKMGFLPNQKWGSGENDVPVTSINDNLIVVDPYFESNGKVFRVVDTISIKSDIPGAAIYFTTDSSERGFSSQLYTEPIRIDKTTTIRAFAFIPEQGKSPIIQGTFYKIPEGRTVDVISKVSPEYTGGGPDALIDQIRGKKNWRLGDWQGYMGQDFEAIVDLGKVQSIHKIGAGFLQDIRSWIFMPTEIEFLVSKDGVNYVPAANIQNDLPYEYNSPVTIKDYNADVNLQARYVKVHAKSYGKIPDWHPGHGDDSWIFVDEIIIE